MQGIALRAGTLESLRVRDALSSRHPVHFARMDRCLGPDAVPVHDLAVEKIRDGRKADVRMRPDVDGARNARRKIHWPDVIEKDERAHHPPFLEGKHTAYLEAAEIAAALIDHHLEHGATPSACAARLY